MLNGLRRWLTPSPPAAAPGSDETRRTATTHPGAPDPAATNPAATNPAATNPAATSPAAGKPALQAPGGAAPVSIQGADLPDAAATGPPARPAAGLLDHFPDGVLMVQTDLRITVGNDQAMRLLRLPGPIIQPGQPLAALIAVLAERGDLGDGDPAVLTQALLDDLAAAPTGAAEITITGGPTLALRKAPCGDSGFLLVITAIPDRQPGRQPGPAAPPRPPDPAGAVLDTVLHAMPQGVVLFDSNRRLAAWNRQYERMLDFPAGFLGTGLPHDDMLRHRAGRGDFGPGDPETLAAIRADHLWARPSGHSEITLRDTRVCDVHTRATPDGGRVVTYTDITGHKRAATDLNRSLELLSAMADALPECIALKDIQGRFMFVNKRFEEWTGLGRDAVIGRTLYEIYPEALAREFDDREHETLIGDPLTTDEMSRVYPDGTIRDIDRTRFKVDGQDGKVLGLGTVHRDISARKAAERATDRSQERLQALADNLPDLVSMKDTDGRFVFINKRFEEWVRRPRETTVGRALHEIYSRDHADAVRALDCRVMQERTTLAEEMDYTYADGQTRSIINTRFPVLSRTGSVLGTGTVHHDMTEQKVIEQALDIARKAAEAASQAKADFLAMMSHEIRTPMNGILGLLELFRATPLDSDQRETLRTVEGSATQLMTVINDILDFSKIQAGKLAIETVPFEPDRLIEDLGDLSALSIAPKSPAPPSAASKPLDVVTYVDPAIAPVLCGDPTRLRQIVSNLLTNAVKFTEAGHVSVEAHLVGEAPDRHGRACQTVRIDVCDTGIGLTADQQGRLFTAYSQAGEATARKYGGTGLGLAICRRLAALMDGSVGVESRVGEGSRFHVDLPLLLPEPPAAEPPAAGPSAAGLADRTVLAGVRIGVAVATAPQRLAVTRYLDAAGATVLPVTLPTVPAGLDGLVVEDEPPWPMLAPLCQDDSQEQGKGQEGEGTPFVLVLGARGRPDRAQSVPRLPRVAVAAKPLSRRRLLVALCDGLGRPVPSGLLADTRADPLTVGFDPPDAARAAAAGAVVLCAEDNQTNRLVLGRQLQHLGLIADFVEDGDVAWERLAADPARFGLLLTDLHMPRLGGRDLAAQVRAREAAGWRSGAGDRLPILALTADVVQEDVDGCLADGMQGCLTKPLELPTLDAALRDLVPAIVAMRTARAAEPAPDRPRNRRQDGPAAVPAVAPRQDAPTATAIPPPLPTGRDGPIDMVRLGALMGSSDPDLLREALSVFRETMDDMPRTLRAAVEARDAAGARDAAHSAKGAAASAAAGALAAALEGLQAAAAAQDWPATDQALADTDRSFAALAAFLDSVGIGRSGAG